MTAMRHAGRLLTIAEYAALPEGERRRWELLEGHLVMTPSPLPRHDRAVRRLSEQLPRAIPRGYVCLLDTEVDLQLAPPLAPGTARRPDLVVAARSEVDGVDGRTRVTRAEAVLLVVEVVSPGTRSTDVHAKRAEYADAGIPHYWIVDIVPPTSVIACHVTPDFGYQDGGAATRRFTTKAPFSFSIDLDDLAT